MQKRAQSNGTARSTSSSKTTPCTSCRRSPPAGCKKRPVRWAHLHSDGVTDTRLGRCADGMQSLPCVFKPTSVAPSQACNKPSWPANCLSDATAPSWPPSSAASARTVMRVRRCPYLTILHRGCASPDCAHVRPADVVIVNRPPQRRFSTILSWSGPTASGARQCTLGPATPTCAARPTRRRPPKFRRLHGPSGQTRRLPACTAASSVQRQRHTLKQYGRVYRARAIVLSAETVMTGWIPTLPKRRVVRSTPMHPTAGCILAAKATGVPHPNEWASRAIQQNAETHADEVSTEKLLKQPKVRHCLHRQSKILQSGSLRWDGTRLRPLRKTSPTVILNLTLLLLLTVSPGRGRRRHLQIALGRTPPPQQSLRSSAAPYREMLKKPKVHHFLHVSEGPSKILA